MLYYTTLYYTILYCTILLYTILYYTILYYTILCYTVLYSTILYYIILYYTKLHYTIQYCTLLLFYILYCCLERRCSPHLFCYLDSLIQLSLNVSPGQKSHPRSFFSFCAFLPLAYPSPPLLSPLFQPLLH